MGIDVVKFNTMLAQVKRLTQALTEQAQANAQLKEQLQAALADSADLRLRLRAAASKRSRSAPRWHTPPMNILGVKRR